MIIMMVGAESLAPTSIVNLEPHPSGQSKCAECSPAYPETNRMRKI